MKAKVTKEFAGRPDQESQVRQILVDEIISGELAAVAVAQKWADEVADDADDEDGTKKTGKKHK